MSGCSTEFLPACRPGVIAVAVVAVMLTSPSYAQDLKEPDLSKARVRLGAVALNPTIELANLGVDTNVFNAPDGLAKKDFTFTLTPKADAWMKVGRTWLSATVREDIVWYQTYSSERSGNTFYRLGWSAPLNRLAFGAQVSYLHARERPGFEIDTRPQRSELEGKVTVEYRALARTSVAVKGGRQRVDFAKDAVFLQSNLQFELDRTVTSGAAIVRHQLTPLTSISIDVGRQQDRFEFSPLRNSDSTVAGVQVTFDPFALIKGTARLGYRDFSPVDQTLPGYNGTTAAVDLTYVLQGSTRVAVAIGRDIQYSYDVERPYYLQTGFSGSLAQQIYGPLDAVVRVGVQRLAYRDRLDRVVSVPDREDTVRTYGGGVGYHVGRDLRIGVNIDKYRRLSDVNQRRYDGLKFGTSVTYGL